MNMPRQINMEEVQLLCASQFFNEIHYYDEPSTRGEQDDQEQKDKGFNVTKT